jgi:hypothetical protein
MFEAPAPDVSTQEGANVRLATLSSDKDWGSRLMSGDPTALAEFDKLSKTASGYDKPAISDEVAKKAIDAFTKSAAAGEGPLTQIRVVREAAGNDRPPTAEELIAFSERTRHVQLAQDLINDALTKFELSPETQAEILNGCRATPEQCAAVARMQAQKLNDRDWTDRLMRSEPTALREQFLMSFILSSDQAKGIPMRAISNLLGIGAHQDRNLSRAL